MSGDSEPRPLGKRSALLAIAVGVGIAGTLDLMQACILFGWDIPLVIAGGLLGRQAFQGGAGTYVLGVLLHFFIACSAAAVYYAASRRLVFMTEHPLVCGLFFGAAVQEVMNLIVLPLSALHSRGPYKLHDLILGLCLCTWSWSVCPFPSAFGGSRNRRVAAFRGSTKQALMFRSRGPDTG
jgi:hypothetical protein